MFKFTNNTKNNVCISGYPAIEPNGTITVRTKAEAERLERCPFLSSSKPETFKAVEEDKDTKKKGKKTL